MFDNVRILLLPHPPSPHEVYDDTRNIAIGYVHSFGQQSKKTSKQNSYLKANPKFKKETLHGERFNSLGFAINLTAPRKKSNVLIAQTLIRMLL